ncbi:MAG: lysostaphin resistance A-like protein [Acutalibacteraceae bacterium]
MYQNYNGGYNPPPYGQDEYYQMVQQNIIRKNADKKEIRILGTLTGAAILLVFLFQNLATLILYLTGLYDSYMKNAYFQFGIDILLTVITILLPFYIFGKVMEKRSPEVDLIPLGKPNSTSLSLLAIPAGLGICMLANIVTSYLTVFLSAFGVKLSSPEMANPTGVSGFILSVLRVCIIAALTEEIALRGCAMQPLRKYGEGFAVAMSACAFGLMHCNLIQAPFALIVGLGLGYITVTTGSLWPAIFIHALNNFVSDIFSYLLDSNVNQNTVNLLYNFIVYFLLIAGLVSLLFYVRKAKEVSPLHRSSCTLSTGEKTWAYIFNPTMIIAIAVMLFYTSAYVKLG